MNVCTSSIQEHVEITPRKATDFCIMPPDGFRGFKLNEFFNELKKALNADITLSQRALGDDDFNRTIMRDRRFLYEA